MYSCIRTRKAFCSWLIHLWPLEHLSSKTWMGEWILVAVKCITEEFEIYTWAYCLPSGHLPTLTLLSAYRSKTCNNNWFPQQNKWHIYIVFVPAAFGTALSMGHNETPHTHTNMHIIIHIKLRNSIFLSWGRDIDWSEPSTEFRFTHLEFDGSRVGHLAVVSGKTLITYSVNGSTGNIKPQSNRGQEKDRQWGLVSECRFSRLKSLKKMVRAEILLHSSLEAAEFNMLAGDEGHLYVRGLLVFAVFSFRWALGRFVPRFVS